MIWQSCQVAIRVFGLLVSRVVSGKACGIKPVPNKCVEHVAVPMESSKRGNERVHREIYVKSSASARALWASKTRTRLNYYFIINDYSSSFNLTLV